MTDEVLFEAADRIAVITLNRPHRRNAFDHPTALALSRALDELDARDDLTVGILTGAGGSFSAGMDLKAIAAGEPRPIDDKRGGFGIVRRPPEKPLIAAVEGFALGGGFEIALACDLIVAAEDAQFGLPEVRRGLVAAAGGAFRLPARIPRGHALEMLLTGDPITAGRAAELGLVSRVTPAGGALDAARELAAKIAANAPLAVRTTKLVATTFSGLPDIEAFTRQEAPVNAVRQSADAAEGARAFGEKRPPVWTGR
jgi:enoyl-CoA hydratase/carnithine racemase